MSKPITTPLLPPRAGYVEVVDDNDNHVYEPTEETRIKLEQEARIAELITQLAEAQSVQDAMLGATDE